MKIQTSWLDGPLLPNISLNEAIGCEQIALVSQNDERLKKIFRHRPNLEIFLNSFTDQFGVSIKPSLIIFRCDNLSSALSFEAIAAFRNILVSCAVPIARAMHIRESGSGIKFAETFEFYPWMLSKDGNSLVGESTVFIGHHSVERIKGQNNPIQPNITRGAHAFDIELLRFLLEAWQSYFLHHVDSHKNIALFRSLNMAHQASLMPSTGLSSEMYDYGRLISLWVSAIEILLHPGGDKTGSRWTIYKVLKEAEWLDQTLAEEAHESGNSADAKNTKGKLNVAGSLYGEMYEARNKFLHGNRIDLNDLKCKRSEVFRFDVAPILYSLLLRYYLGVIYPDDLIDDIETDVSGYLNKYVFYQKQLLLEHAVRGAFCL
ncbi:hypothetical protein E1178_18225 [Roseibium hamelinense]|nr:hypothetical protein [Roseibium hamelinense]MTI45545.1 hypothetical protein [Roseibium hamelinense]